MAVPSVLEPVTLTKAAWHACRSGCAVVADFRLCRNRVRICSDDRRAADAFAAWYVGFEVAVEGDADLQLWARREDEPCPAWLFVIDDGAWRCDAPTLVADPLPVLSHLLLPRIRSHFLVHAGGVGRDGQAILLTGASGMGKTTLSAMLAARGLAFLADEIAPLHRLSGEIDPFPLPVGLREGPAAALLAHVPGREVVFVEETKRMVAPRDWGHAVADAPLPLHAVVVLTRQMSDDVRTPCKFDGRMRLWVEGMDEAFLRDLQQTTGASLLSNEPMGLQSASLLLSVPEPATFLSRLRAVAARCGTALVDIAYEDFDPGDRSKAPELRALPMAAGVLELAKRIGAGQKARLIRDVYGGQTPRLIEALLSAVRDARFYKLSPGRLDDMLDILCNLP